MPPSILHGMMVFTAPGEIAGESRNYLKIPGSTFQKEFFSGE
jgi:hypothetical protein